MEICIAFNIRFSLLRNNSYIEKQPLLDTLLQLSTVLRVFRMAKPVGRTLMSWQPNSLYSIKIKS